MTIEVISVFGSSAVPEGHPDYLAAVHLGRLLAEEDFAVANGGYGGIMEAVSRGAKEAGGRTIGVTTKAFPTRSGPNRWIDEEIETDTLYQRITEVIRIGDAHIAMPGGPGTFAEIGLVWNLRQRGLLVKNGPVVLVGKTWDDMMAAFGETEWVRPKDMDLLERVAGVEEAVRIIVDANHQDR